MAFRQDRPALGARDRKAVRPLHVQDEFAAHGAGEARSSCERDELLVERPGEGRYRHRRLLNTPTTLPITFRFIMSFNA